MRRTGTKTASVYCKSRCCRSTGTDSGRGDIFHRYDDRDPYPESIPKIDGGTDELCGGTPAVYH